MKLIHKILIFSISILTITNCTNEIPLNATYNPKAVVYGLIENTENSTVYIDIHKTTDVNTTAEIPINTAQIALYTRDNNENVTQVTNQFTADNGLYRSANTVNTIIGNSYWIEVTLEDGTVLNSDIELLKPPVHINSITRENDLTKVTFSDPKNDTNFYMIAYEAYDDNDNFLNNRFVLSNDVLFNGNNDAFVEVDDSNGSKVIISILNMNFNTYQFFSNALEQIENQSNGGIEIGDPSQLFMSPPANLTGNITNTTTGRRALGNFGVVAESEIEVTF